MVQFVAVDLAAILGSPYHATMEHAFSRPLTALVKRIILILKNRLAPSQVLIFLAIFIGLGTGLMALILKNLVHYFETIVNVWGRSLEKGGSLEGVSQFWRIGAEVLLVASPAIGILLTILLVKYVIKDDVSHGLSKVLQSIAVKNGEMPVHSTWSYVASCSLTSGFGGSVGMEAPILATGAGIGSNIARIFGLSYRHTVVLIGCGAAAAIAAIFKAPIAGLIIALEVLAIDSTAMAILPILLASVSAALLSMGISSDAIEFYFTVHHNFAFVNIPWYALLGVLCGFFSLLFSRTSWKIEARFKKMQPMWRFIIGAGLVGALILVFPPLYGEGYEPMRALLSGHPETLQAHPLYASLVHGDPSSLLGAWSFVGFLLIVLFLKIFATPLTTGAGGVGGIFAPSLFMGCLAGLVFARIVNLSGLPGLIGMPTAPEENMALVGMAGMLAGIMHAPLTAIFLIAEITGGYGLFIPLIICSGISYYTIHRFEKHSVYTRTLARQGQLITHEKDKSALSLMQLPRFIRNDAPIISPSLSLASIVALVTQSKSEVFAVMDGMDFRGFVFVDNIRQILFVQESYRLVCAQDLLEVPPIMLHLNQSMEEVLVAFNALATSSEDAQTSDSTQYLPVLDDTGLYCGFVYHSDVLEGYRQKIIDISSED